MVFTVATTPLSSAQTVVDKVVCKMNAASGFWRYWFSVGALLVGR